MPRGLLRWYAHKRTDAYLISYPKCGRTWLRLMIGKAIAIHFQLPDDEDTLFIRWKKRIHPQVPFITVIHDDRPMLKTPEELETSKIRYAGKKVVFLARDPRDVIVSSYFEMKHRGKLFGDNPYESHPAAFEGSLEEFLFRKRSGVDTIIHYYNIWADNQKIPQAFLLVRYEDLRAAPTQELRRILNFLDLEAVTDKAIDEAVAFASFDNMRKLEIDEKFQSSMLKPADRQDEETYKTRKGKIKGYLDYLSAEDTTKLNHKIQTDLSDFFGYH